VQSNKIGLSKNHSVVAAYAPFLTPADDLPSRLAAEVARRKLVGAALARARVGQLPEVAAFEAAMVALGTKCLKAALYQDLAECHAGASEALAAGAALGDWEGVDDARTLLEAQTMTDLIARLRREHEARWQAEDATTETLVAACQALPSSAELLLSPEAIGNKTLEELLLLYAKGLADRCVVLTGWALIEEGTHCHEPGCVDAKICEMVGRYDKLRSDLPRAMHRQLDDATKRCKP
jgi:hypothetical protein